MQEFHVRVSDKKTFHLGRRYFYNFLKSEVGWKRRLLLVQQPIITLHNNYKVMLTTFSKGKTVPTFFVFWLVVGFGSQIFLPKTIQLHCRKLKREQGLKNGKCCKLGLDLPILCPGKGIYPRF
uniref:Ovule protein n=1 Tax=Panagrellus redivivus TaxID=6233 RepID=A0A7E4V5T0_PANRE